MPCIRCHTCKSYQFIHVYSFKKIQFDQDKIIQTYKNTFGLASQFLNNRTSVSSSKWTPFSVLIATIALSLGVLGEDYSASSGPWCWIKDCDTIPLSPIFWMFLAGKFWEILAYIGTFAIYMLLKAERWNSLRMVNPILRFCNFRLMLKKNHMYL